MASFAALQDFQPVRNSMLVTSENSQLASTGQEILANGSSIYPVLQRSRFGRLLFRKC